MHKRVHFFRETPPDNDVLSPSSPAPKSRLRGGSLFCFEGAKKGFVTLFGEGHVKSVEATFQLVIQTCGGDERVAELRSLWERLKVRFLMRRSLMMSQTSWGGEPFGRRQYEEANVLNLAAFEGRRKVLGEEHKKTLASLATWVAPLMT